MARSKSVVLTPAEKKAVVVDLKAKIKVAKAEKKDVETGLKAGNKTLATLAKTLTGFEAQLAALSQKAA